MTKLLKKEIKLSASPLSFIFIAFGLMAFVPGYPILTGSFFACFGLFHSFQASREANDVTYSALLPVAKSDVVRAKYAFCVFIQLCYFVLTTAVTLLRMTALRNSPVYLSNVLMPANFVYLGFVLLILGCFNAIFVRGFFKTAYKFSRPFVVFIVAAFLLDGLGETLFHIPGLTALGSAGFEHLGTQLSALCIGAAAYALMTVKSMQSAIQAFEKVDL